VKLVLRDFDDFSFSSFKLKLSQLLQNINLLYIRGLNDESIKRKLLIRSQ